MLQADEPEDYVIATGVEHSVREFAEIAFEHAGLDMEQACRRRPGVPAAGRGRPPRRRRVEGAREARLGTARFVPELVEMMVDADLERLTASATRPELA